MKIYDETLQQYVEVSIKALDSMPIGSIILFAGETIPTGWLICDGEKYYAGINGVGTEYPDLFSVIGYTYGSYKGEDFYRVPDLKGRVPVGLDSTQTEFDTLGETGGSKYLQQHKHIDIEIANNHITAWNSKSGSTGIFSLESLNAQNGTANENYMLTGNVHETQTGNSGNLQPYLVVNYIIKATNTTPTMASVVNATNNSTTDTYSCDYLNDKLSDKLQAYNLYYNSSGSSGEITLSSGRSNYEFLIITWANGSSSFSTIVDKSANYVQLGGTYSSMGYNYMAVFGKMYNISENAISPNIYSTYAEVQYNFLSGTWSGLTTDSIKIIKVVGYK